MIPSEFEVHVLLKTLQRSHIFATSCAHNPDVHAGGTVR